MEDYRHRLVVIVAGYPAADAPLPRLEPGPALAVLTRDRLPGLLDGRAARDHGQVRWPRTSTASARAPRRRCGGSSTAPKRGEGFGNARFARTLFEQALNAQALRLAGRLDEVDRDELLTLTAEDFPAGARALGEEPAAERPRGGLFRRR